MYAATSSRNINLRREILKYLNSKGKVKAALYHKLEKRFCSQGSKFKVNKLELISELLLLVKERVIELIIPELFQVKWKKQYMKDLKFLQNGKYFIRKFEKYKGFEQNSLNNNYFFDSRKFNFKNDLNIDFHLENIKKIILRHSKIKYKIIFFYPEGSEPINIYDPYEGDFKLDFFEFYDYSSNANESSKLFIPIEQQRETLLIIKSYRTNYMCFYITLIEAIQKAISNIQENREKLKIYEKKLKDYIIKFANYCDLFVRSDWVEPTHSNPYRWETFFVTFNLPFKILEFKFKTIRFYNRTFDSSIQFKFCINIRKRFTEIIKILKNHGFQEFSEVESKDSVAIGLDLEIFLPCSTIEHFYFVFKYIYYYHLFLLFYYSFPYFKGENSRNRFTEKEREIYKIFLPVITSLFKINEGEMCKKLIFKYYTLDPNELEIIYNNFLVNKIKIIEKTLFNYFLIRTSKI
ncbi:MAG: hypothetical protein ACTSPD_13110 [Promethearchaeota archaeon]